MTFLVTCHGTRNKIQAPDLKTLVKRYSMKYTMRVLFLLNLQNIIYIFVDISRCFDLETGQLSRGSNQKLNVLTAAAKSSIAFPAI